MKLSRTVAYALRASLLLAKHESNGPVPCSRLARDGNMPERFLLQILRSMVTHGVLQSTRGVDGGYALARSSENISLLNIVEAIDGPMVLSIPAAEEIPRETRRRLEHQLDQLLVANRERLDKITLDSLITSKARTTAN